MSESNRRHCRRVSPSGSPSASVGDLCGGWVGSSTVRRRRDRQRHRLVCADPDRLSVVDDLERPPRDQRVDRLVARDLDHQPALAEAQPEREPGQRRRQPRREAELAAVVAHAAEAGDQPDPGARQRRDVQSVAGVVLEVVEVDQRGLAQIGVGELEVPDLGGDDRLGDAESDESRTVSRS